MPQGSQSWQFGTPSSFDHSIAIDNYWQYNPPWDGQPRQDFSQTTDASDNTCSQHQSYYSHPMSTSRGSYGTSFNVDTSASLAMDANVKRPSTSAADSSVHSSPATTSKRPRLDEVATNAQLGQPWSRHAVTEGRIMSFPEQFSQDPTPELEQSFDLSSGRNYHNEVGDCLNSACTPASSVSPEHGSSTQGPCFDFTFCSQQPDSQHEAAAQAGSDSSVPSGLTPSDEFLTLAGNNVTLDEQSLSPEVKEFDRRRAHSAVERKYRGNLNSKIESLRVVLGSTHLAYVDSNAASSASVTEPFLPVGSKKADVLTNAIYYVQETRASRLAAVQEIAFLKARMLGLEKMTRCEDCTVLKKLASMEVGGTLR